MALHLFRPADPTPAHPSPSWKAWRGLLAVAVWRGLALARDLCDRPALRGALHICLIVCGLVVQLVLLLTVAYLCDLALSLMELWADLARKHLELTL